MTLCSCAPRTEGAVAFLLSMLGALGTGAGSPTEVIFQLTPIMGVTVLLLSVAHERLWYTLPGARAGAGCLWLSRGGWPPGPFQRSCCLASAAATLPEGCFSQGG